MDDVCDLDHLVVGRTVDVEPPPKIQKILDDLEQTRCELAKYRKQLALKEKEAAERAEEAAKVDDFLAANNKVIQARQEALNRAER